MAILVKSTTPTGEKNRWGTTWECFNDAQTWYMKRFGVGFEFDVCAEPQTAKVNQFYVSTAWARRHYRELMRGEFPGVQGVDALSNEWPSHWWCNPPFDNKPEFCIKAYEEDLNGRHGMMLLPYEPMTGWWLDHVEGKAARILVPDGRYGFYEVDGVTKKYGVNFGSAFVLWNHRERTTPIERIVRFNSKRR